MKKSLWIFVLIIVLLMTACGGSETGTDSVAPSVTAETGNVVEAEPANGNGEDVLVETETANRSEEPVTAEDAPTGPVPVSGDIGSLATAYDDALDPEGQLALGTIELEGTALAVDETQAATLLPLWQAFQALTASGTAAEVELDAVAAQIAQTMRAAQIAAIGEMQLTNQQMAELAAEGGLGLGRGQGTGQGAGTGPGAGSAIPGTGGGMGRGFGSGEPGAGGTVDADTMATRQAERESSAFQEQALTAAVIRLLQTKTGDTPQSGLVAETVVNVIAAETGLDSAAIQEQMAAGTTAVAIIEAAGGDVESARAALLAALNQLENAAELDVQGIVDRWLGQ